MSLHPIAEAVRSQGRNGDSMLVHMTPGEVAALQRMAEANGGSLSINPETGQPEAFFLAALLPALAGAAMPAIAASTGIAALANPLTASLLVGGLTGAITGDMKQGLMAGLGAYGGFGLGESLMGAGTTAAATTPAVTAAGAVNPASVASGAGDAAMAQQMAMRQSITPAATSGVVTNPILGGEPVVGGIRSLQTEILPYGAENIAAAQRLKISAMPNVYGPAPVASAVAPAASVASGAGDAAIAQQMALQQSTAPVAAAVQPTPSMMEAIRSGSGTVTGGDVFSQMGGGLKSITSSGGAAGDFLKGNVSNIAMAATPALMAEGEPDKVKGDTAQYYYPEFSSGQLSKQEIDAQYADRPGTTAERLYRQVRYGPRQSREVTAAQGGRIPGYQYGGIPEMVPRGVEGPQVEKPQATEGQRSMARMLPTALGLAGMNPLGATIAGVAATLGIERNNPALGGSITNGILPALTGGYQDPAPVVGMNDMRVVSPGGPGQAPVVTSDSTNGGYTAGVGTQGSASYSNYGGEADLAAGGVASLSYKQGGLKEDSFIIPADVLAALGNGSNDAGLMALNKMLTKVGAPRAEKIDGPGDGKSDSIPTSIEGRQPARVAKDEAYVPTESVRRLGGGDVKKGAKKLYDLMSRVRRAAHGTDKQQRTVNPDRMVRA